MSHVEIWFRKQNNLNWVRFVLEKHSRVIPLKINQRPQYIKKWFTNIIRGKTNYN